MDDNYKLLVIVLFEIIKFEMKIDKFNYLFFVCNDLFDWYMKEWLLKYILNLCIDLYCIGFFLIFFNVLEYL